MLQNASGDARTARMRLRSAAWLLLALAVVLSVLAEPDVQQTALTGAQGAGAGAASGAHSSAWRLYSAAASQ